MEEHSMQPPRRTSRMGMRLAVSLLLCVLTLCAKQYAPQAAQALRPWIVGPEDGRVAMAFAALSSSMAQGAEFHEAIQAFYAEMTGDGIS